MLEICRGRCRHGRLRLDRLVAQRGAEAPARAVLRAIFADWRAAMNASASGLIFLRK
jgi:hypothetical protein